MHLHFMHNRNDILNIGGRSEKHLLGNIHNLVYSTVSNGGGKTPQVTRAPCRQSFHGWLVRHRDRESAIKRPSLCSNKIQETVNVVPTTKLGPVAHGEHVHPMRANSRLQSQRLKTRDISHAPPQQVEIGPARSLLVLEVLESMQQQCC